MNKTQRLIVMSLKGFLTDPVDTSYQQGYLAALLELYETSIAVGELSEDQYLSLKSQI